MLRNTPQAATKMHTGFISREQHHHKHTHARARRGTVDGHASSEPEHVQKEGWGRETEGEAENDNSAEAVQVAKEIKQAQKAK